MPVFNDVCQLKTMTPVMISVVYYHCNTLKIIEIMAVIVC